jgi:DNA-binding beta-propeller fold protein YncE
MEIVCSAPESVRAVIGTLGRTEDVRFSPDNRRLAVAAFNNDRIVVFDIEVAQCGATREVALTGAIELSSRSLNRPHGLDFLDDETLAVASRMEDVAIFRLPPSGKPQADVSPIRILSKGDGSLLSAPGSISVVRLDPARCELLVCNNTGHSLSRHVIDRAAGCSVMSSAILLKKWLNLPDGVCVSRDRRWIAVSNHNSHQVLVYATSPSLNETSRPDGVLRGVYFPHGLRFCAGGRNLFVADAGAPFVHVFASGEQGWGGVRTPAASIRIMDDALFMRGRQDPQEGGPKGIDIDREEQVLVATSEHQPLAFFDAGAILAGVAPTSPVMDVEYEFGILEQAERLRVRAGNAEARAANAEARLQKRKAKWLPKSLRKAFSAWR